VFRSRLVVEELGREVESTRPGTAVEPPAGDPLAGARLLAELGPELKPEPGILSTWT
jgi:hypothetical protein